MKIDEYWSIESDAACWTLRYYKEGPERNSKGDLVKSSSSSYHATFEQALKHYCDASLKVSDELKDVKDALAAAMAKIEKLTAGIKRK